MVARSEARDERREQLIRATIRSARRGLDGASIKRIAAVAGVSRGLIHHYFKNRDELLSAAYLKLAEDMQVAMEDAASRHSDPLLRLVAVVKTAVAPQVFSRTALGAWSGFWRASQNSSRLRQINRMIYARYRSDMAELVDKAAEARDMRVNSSEVGWTLTSLMDGFWIELAVDKTSIRPEAAALHCIDYLAPSLA